MPDWEALVRARLDGLALDAEAKHEVLLELASHLEDTYESLLREGMPEADAIHHVLLQVGDWNDLQRKIQIARTKENTMTTRTSRFWLPSLVTLTVSMSLLPLLERLGLKPEFLFLRGPQHETYIFTVYTAWLMMLPLVGALGAHLSRRAGGTRPAIITSGIFPALAFSAVLFLVLPFVGFLEHGLETGARPLFQKLTTTPFGLLGLVTGWVLMPGACLLIGVLAFQAVAKWRVKLAG